MVRTGCASIDRWWHLVCGGASTHFSIVFLHSVAPRNAAYERALGQSGDSCL